MQHQSKLYCFMVTLCSEGIGVTDSVFLSLFEFNRLNRLAAHAGSHQSLWFLRVRDVHA